MADDRTRADLFAERAGEYRAGIHRCVPAGLAATLADLLGDATAVVTPPGTPTAWTSRLGAPTIADADPTGLDRPGIAVLTGCALAIAETGTIVLDGGAAQGTRRLTLVPDHHVCVVRTDQIVADVPDMIAALPDRTRPLTMISGPSATSDIELDRVEGVHGPRRLDIVVLGPEAGGTP